MKKNKEVVQIATESQRKARNKYNYGNTINKTVQLNIKLDKDIIEYIEGKKFNTLVKELIRKDMKAK